jgi:hypothetical protein
MMPSEQRRPQIQDDEPEQAQRSDARPPGETPAPRNRWVQEDIRVRDDTWKEDAWKEDAWKEDAWVTGFVARLAALIRDVGGSGK